MLATLGKTIGRCSPKSLCKKAHIPKEHELFARPIFPAEKDVGVEPILRISKHNMLPYITERKPLFLWNMSYDDIVSNRFTRVAEYKCMIL